MAWRKTGWLAPALAWLLIRFAMTGALTAGLPAGAVQIDICSAAGIERIVVDPATGQPAEPEPLRPGCDWCATFGLSVALDPPVSVGSLAPAQRLACRPDAARRAPPSLRPAADFFSRAPPLS